MAVDHYENFPVASLLLPARLRPAVRNLYAFARGADDIADEGDACRDARLARLEAWRSAVRDLGAGRPIQAPLAQTDRAIFARLGDTLAHHQLPIQPLLDLLSAFTQDLDTVRYADEPALLDYCRRSANPVGRLMLHLFGHTAPSALAWSDALCTGLQRVNFCQDVALDHAKGRCYIPLDCLERHGLDPDDQDALCADPPTPPSDAWRAAVREQAGLAHRSLLAGSPLAWSLPGRIGLELRLVVHGGLRILEKLAAGGYDPWNHRPILGRADAFLLCWRAFLAPRPDAALPTHHDA
ncbi:MAG: squalene synthase HpnC [Castellaniella sp.]|uniref:squalene synthase HpnC n=1 Tax=Castellaniella sp. TaxID=1955812 RepID=UPI002A367A30|nr:squalene synthase HpnC [Castellaniella sp.]MDY0310209.1 squalene synthase HpnC [Castellaniella sp.]